MSHPFSAHLRLSYLDATLIANNPLIAYPFILTTKAFKVFGWAKDPLTEKSVSLRLQGTVINGLRLDYLAVRPAFNLFW
jgi:hypothetical protein